MTIEIESHVLRHCEQTRLNSGFSYVLLRFDQTMTLQAQTLAVEISFLMLLYIYISSK
jgi:hypothetical protein